MTIKFYMFGSLMKSGSLTMWIGELLSQK